MNSKRKGKTGELEAAHKWKDAGYDCHRMAQCRGDTGQAADIEGVPGLHLEIKRNERLNVYDAMEQAVRDTHNDDLPVVMWRKNNCDWLMTMRFDDFIQLYREWESGFVKEQ